MSPLIQSVAGYNLVHRPIETADRLRGDVVRTNPVRVDLSGGQQLGRFIEPLGDNGIVDQQIRG